MHTAVNGRGRLRRPPPARRRKALLGSLRLVWSGLKRLWVFQMRQEARSEPRPRLLKSERGSGRGSGRGLEAGVGLKASSAALNAPRGQRRLHRRRACLGCVGLRWRELERAHLEKRHTGVYMSSSSLRARTSKRQKRASACGATDAICMEGASSPSPLSALVACASCPLCSEVAENPVVGPWPCGHVMGCRECVVARLEELRASATERKRQRTTAGTFVVPTQRLQCAVCKRNWNGKSLLDNKCSVNALVTLCDLVRQANGGQKGHAATVCERRVALLQSARDAAEAGEVTPYYVKELEAFEANPKVKYGDLLQRCRCAAPLPMVPKKSKKGAWWRACPRWQPGDQKGPAGCCDAIVRVSKADLAAWGLD